MKILITGINGSAGSYLGEFISKIPNCEIFGTVRNHSGLSNIQHIKDKINLLYLDMMDFPSLLKAIDRVRPDLIFHIASMANVRSSFDSPTIVINNNVNITLNILEVVRLLKEKYHYNPIIQICCHDEKTEVLTNRGFLKYNELKNEDLVVSINPITENVEFKPIKNIFIQDYTGKMIKLKNRSINSMVTPNHKIIFKKYREEGYLFQEAKDFPNNTTRYTLPSGKHFGKTNETFNINGSEYNTKDLFYLIGLYIGDGYSKTQIRKIPNKSGLSREDFLKFSRNKQGKLCKIEKGNVEYSITHSHRCFLAIPKQDKARKKAIECLKRMNIKYSAYKKEIYFSSEDFVIFFQQFGKRAIEKCIPEWMFEYDSSILEYLYFGLIDSDGYYFKNNIGQRLSTSSIKLVDGFTTLCLFTGRNVTSLKRAKRNSILKSTGRIIKANIESFLCYATKSPRSFSGNNFIEEDYNGKIWCLEVEGNNNFVVRRDGKTCYSGNSTSEVYGNPNKENIPIDENCPLLPINPYASSKLMQDNLGHVYHLNFGLNIIRTRMFSYFNPRRPDLFATKFAHQILDVVEGKRELVEHGNLTSIRTILGPMEAAECYWLAATQFCKIGEVYNVGGQEPISVGDVLKALIKKSGIDIKTQESKNLLRPSDISIQIPNITKFHQATGWNPKNSLQQNIDDFWLEVNKIYNV